MITELKPTIVRKIWGGKKLEQMKHLPMVENVEPIGETWEVYLSHLPYLAKFIDTSDELSIQVHPGDEYARTHENSLGKTECWIIVEAEIGAGIYLGLKPNVTKSVLKEALASKKPIDQLLNFYQVKKGDFFYVPAGSIHAIGKGITLAEVQQNSGITYRVWDWERLDEKGVSRELHVDKSLDVINFEAAANTAETFQIKHDLFELKGETSICTHSHFHLSLMNLKKGEKVIRAIDQSIRPCSLLNLRGEIIANQTKLDSYQAAILDGEIQLTIEALEDGSVLVID